MAKMIVLQEVYKGGQVTLIPCFIVKKELITFGEPAIIGAKTLIHYEQNEHRYEFYVKESIEEIDQLCTG